MYVPLGQRVIVYTPEVQAFLAREPALKAETQQKVAALRAEYARLEDFWNKTHDPESGVDPADRPKIEEALQTVYQALQPLERATSDWPGWFQQQLDTFMQQRALRIAEAQVEAALVKAEAHTAQMARVQREREQDAAAVAQHRAIQMQVAVERAAGRKPPPNHSLDDL